MIRKLTTLVVAITATTSLHAQTEGSVHEVPKLVIGITIDQLRGDYLKLFQHTFSEKGFKRLLREGLVYENMVFNQPNLDEASAIATLYTGTTPYYHGIVGNNKYLVKEGLEISTFADEDYLGNYTEEKVSPVALKVSTIADELKFASRGSSDVYSFSPNPAAALITAGHDGNCAYWINTYSGQWASSTYYRDFYWTIDQENRSNQPFARTSLDKFWTPLISPKELKTFPYARGGDSFQHSMIVNTKEAYKGFKKSPFVNEGIRDMAINLITNANLGNRIVPDFVALTFYAGNFPNVGSYSNEIQDTYIRLDREIELLLNQLDETIGLENTFIFLTSTGYYDENEELEILLKSGTFHVNRCEALLNMYLMAIYGNEQWVDKFHGNQIYLNRKLIAEKELSLKDIQQKAAEFVVEFTGVQDVYTSYSINHGEWNPVMEYYKNGYTKETAGDLFVEIQPGYNVVNDQDITFKEKNVRNNAVNCPVIFFGSNIKPERIKRTIKATEIAPSVTHVLRIRPPNATKETALPEL